MFAMIGTLFLWLYWPSFNAATAKDEGQLRAVINTYIAITASCITTFIASTIVGKGKLNMVHIQNATLAGGVAVGAVADLNIQPFAAAIIGSLAGIVSTLGFQYSTKFLNRYVKLHDTCGIHNLHGVPGLVSGITSIIVAAVATRETYGGDRLYVFYPSRIPMVDSNEYLRLNLANSDLIEVRRGGLGRTAQDQALFQLIALTMTLWLAIISGTFVGVILRFEPIFGRIGDEKDMFTDKNSWILEEPPLLTVDNLNSFKMRTDTLTTVSRISPSIDDFSVREIAFSESDYDEEDPPLVRQYDNRIYKSDGKNCLFYF
jgi:ammonium transporter Rh